MTFPVYPCNPDMVYINYTVIYYAYELKFTHIAHTYMHARNVLYAPTVTYALTHTIHKRTHKQTHTNTLDALPAMDSNELHLHYVYICFAWFIN